MQEIWEDINGYEGLYQVSNLGRVKSLPKKYSICENILKPDINKYGHHRVTLCKDRNQTRYLVHRLVASAFIPNTENKPNINHIDNNPSNNHVDNLEWCTQKENIHHSMKQGRLVYTNGEINGRSKLTEKDVLWIRKNKKNLTSKNMAKILNVKYTTIRSIISRRRWTHI